MTHENRTSRIAGLVYLVVVLSGLFSLAWVPSQIAVADDLPATLANMIASASLYRWGVASFLLNQVAFLVLPLVLYRLLRPVDPDIATIMVALAVVSVPIALVSLVHRLDALSLLTHAGYRSAFTADQMTASVGRALDAYRNGVRVASLFWGLWLLPFGYLVFKSGFLPRILGALLMLGCLGYLIHVFGNLLVPGYADTLVSKLALKPAALGEIGTCLWLLLVGARPAKGRTAAPQAPA